EAGRRGSEPPGRGRPAASESHGTGWRRIAGGPSRGSAAGLRLAPGESRPRPQWAARAPAKCDAYRAARPRPIAQAPTRALGVPARRFDGLLRLQPVDGQPDARWRGTSAAPPG